MPKVEVDKTHTKQNRTFCRGAKDFGIITFGNDSSSLMCE